tara:strand:+ start:786 stop:1397 length:612 start_codon:yes stop_codon:yes gene_type:complete
MITDKKIAVIGHTKGLGKLVFENLQELGNDVSGFSKSLGYDISDAEDRQSIVKKSSECDVIINNAYNFDAWDDAQMHMLMDLYGRHYSDWNTMNMSRTGNDKVLLINIGSTIDQYSDELFATKNIYLDDEQKHYRRTKNNVNNFCLDKQICNIKFGPIKSGLTLNQAGLDNAFDPEVMYNAMLFIMDNYFNRDGLFVYNLELS